MNLLRGKFSKLHFVGGIALTLLCGITAPAQDRTDDSSQAARREPLTIAINNNGAGMMGMGGWWDISINAAGNALIVDDKSSREVRLTAQQMDAIRQQLTASDYFKLKPTHGIRLFDSDVITLTVIEGGKSHSVQLYYALGGETHADIKQAMAALKVLIVVLEPTMSSQLPYHRRRLDQMTEGMTRFQREQNRPGTR